MTDINTNEQPADSREFTSQPLDNPSKSLSASALSKSLFKAAAGTVSPSSISVDGNWRTKAKPGFGSKKAIIPTSTNPPTSTPFLSTPTITDAITTPFVYDPSCTSLRSICGGDLFPTDILCIKRSDPEWQDCQPTIGEEHSLYTEFQPYSGTKTEIRHVYSKAVCPAGWVALDVGLQYKTLATITSTGVSWTYPFTSTLMFSTAWCCDGNDRLDHDSWNLYSPGPTILINDGRQTWKPICVGYWGVGNQTMTTEFVTDTRSGKNEEIALTTGTRMYPAWYIEWQSRDLEELSPRWPELTSNMLIPTWSEGMVLESGKFDNKGRLSYKPASATPRGSDEWDEGKTHTFLTVHLPLIVSLSIAFLIGLIIWYCCRENRKAKDRDEIERTGTCRKDRRKAEKRQKAQEREEWRAGERAAGRAKWWCWKRESQVDMELEERGLEIPLEVRSS